MPFKRPKTVVEEEALLTRPLSPHEDGTSKVHREEGGNGYELEYSGADPDIERQSLLTSTTLVDSGKAYRDRFEEDDYIASESLPKSRRIAPGRVQRWYRMVLGLAAVVAAILVGGTLARAVFNGITGSSGYADDPHAIMSNGTHNYKKTVLLVSIDGLRADYLDEGLTPHLLHISKRGLRGKFMKPAFPTLTFPNHWTLMTGLHPESHGIVGNNFYDPKLDAEFLYTDPGKSHNGKWWGGEPMWETASKAGMNTAVMMWPGPPTTASGVSPTYLIPFHDDTSMFEKVSHIVEWLEMPFEHRPRFIAVYEPLLDEIGHLAGPSSPRVRAVLEQVDVFAREIHQAIQDRNLTHIVDLIYVSDHGMTDTDKQRVVYLDEIIGEEGVNDVIYEDGWPNFGLRFAPSANVSHYLSVLQEYSVSRHPDPPFEVYTHETMPERYHFSNSDRIAPIYLCPRLGWVLSNHHEVGPKTDNPTWRPKGTHGYDNEEKDMRAVFVADGPFANRANVGMRARSPSDSDSVKIIPGFPNLELYGLVTKLLGLTPAPNNGTRGFWDQYL